MDIKKFESFNKELSGWVNVKIDNQLGIRMSRYIPALDRLSKGNKYNLAKKIDVLSGIDKKLDDRNISIRDKISIISILQYLKEIRDETNFNPSSSGFLFERFIASLVYGRILNDYSATDMISYISDDPETTNRRKLNFQIKLYKSGNDIKVNFSQVCDFYVICLKGSNNVSIHILDGKNPTLFGRENTYYIGNFARGVRGGKDAFIRSDNGGKEYVIVDTKRLENLNPHKRILDVGDLDALIIRCGENIQKSIKSVYDYLSDLHYDIDSIIIGRDKNRKYIDIDTAAGNAIKTIDEISKEIGNLRKNLLD
jgi:hypothetical protein